MTRRERRERVPAARRHRAASVRWMEPFPGRVRASLPSRVRLPASAGAPPEPAPRLAATIWAPSARRASSTRRSLLLMTTSSSESWNSKSRSTSPSSRACASRNAHERNAHPCSHRHSRPDPSSGGAAAARDAFAAGASTIRFSFRHADAGGSELCLCLTSASTSMSSKRWSSNAEGKSSSRAARATADTTRRAAPALGAGLFSSMGHMARRFAPSPRPASGNAPAPEACARACGPRGRGAWPPRERAVHAPWNAEPAVCASARFRRDGRRTRRRRALPRAARGRPGWGA